MLLQISEKHGVKHMGSDITNIRYIMEKQGIDKRDV